MNWVLPSPNAINIWILQSPYIFFLIYTFCYKPISWCLCMAEFRLGEEEGHQTRTPLPYSTRGSEHTWWPAILLQLWEASLGAESFPRVFWCVTKIISAAWPQERAGPWGRCHSWWGLTLDFQPQSVGEADQVGKGAGKRLRNLAVCMNGHQKCLSNPLWWFLSCWTIFDL